MLHDTLALPLSLPPSLPADLPLIPQPLLDQSLILLLSLRPQRRRGGGRGQQGTQGFTSHCLAARQIGGSNHRGGGSGGGGGRRPWLGRRTGGGSSTFVAVHGARAIDVLVTRGGAVAGGRHVCVRVSTPESRSLAVEGGREGGRDEKWVCAFREMGPMT